MLIVLLTAVSGLTASGSLEGEQRPTCGEGETLFEGSCYWVGESGSFTYAEAVEACRGRGMRLASIHSQRENAFINALTDGWSSWIGLSDALTEGDFQWLDGSPLDYQNWGTLQPDGGDLQDCAYIYGFSGYWKDFMCDYHEGAVCKGAPVLEPAEEAKEAERREVQDEEV